MKLLRERNAELYNRIHNLKFGQTLQYAKEEPKDVVELLRALDRVLGNIGWVSSKEVFEDSICWEDINVDDLGIILRHALKNIGYDGLILMGEE